ncbi:MAG: glycosyltransferase, partial [Acidimicrobiales bacterium]
MRRASLLVDFVAVVIPAHDEEEMIGPCLEALDRACRHEALRGLEVRPILVLDRCSDSTGERSEAAARTTARRLTILETCRANVGVARRRGFETALELSEGLDPRRAWFATTDADTLVRPDWLAGQLAWRQRRVDAVAGTVEVGSWAEQPGTLPRRYERHVKRHGLGLGHPHVHGANLSFSRASYEAAGGMPALPA